MIKKNKARNRHSCAFRTAVKKKLSELEICEIHNQRQVQRRIAKESGPPPASRTVDPINTRVLLKAPFIKEQCDADYLRSINQPLVDIKAIEDSDGNVLTAGLTIW